MVKKEIVDLLIDDVNNSKAIHIIDYGIYTVNCLKTKPNNINRKDVYMDTRNPYGYNYNNQSADRYKKSDCAPFITSTQNNQFVTKDGDVYKPTNYHDNITLRNIYGRSLSFSNAQLIDFLKDKEWELFDEKLKLVEIQFRSEVEKGQQVVFMEAGHFYKGQIVEIYPFTKVEDKYYKIKTDDNQLFDIRYSWTDIRLIVDDKYVKIDEEYTFLNSSINAEKLNAHNTKNQNSAMVIWKPIDNAVLYNVELYFYMNGQIANTTISFYERRLYKLETSQVDRNVQYKTFSNLGAGLYYIRVLAEDKEGNVIAQSLGLKCQI